MTFIIVIVFVICWCPYFVFNLLQVYVFYKWPRSETLVATTVFMQSMSFINSAVNPIIYGVFSTRICSNLRRIRAVDFIARLVCPCPLKRNKAEARSSRGSWNDPTLMTEGSTKSTPRNHGGLIKRTIPEDSPVSSNKFSTLNPHGKKVLFEGTSNNVCYGKKTKPKHFRRPSGLPLVKRTLTEEDSNLLKAITHKRRMKIEESKI